MDKWKEILIALSNQIDSKELSAAVDAGNFSGEYEPSEEAADDIINQMKGLMTVEAAKNNPVLSEFFKQDLFPKHKKSALSKVEELLKPIYDKVGLNYSEHEFISDALPDLGDALEKSLTSGDNKKLIESLKADLSKRNEDLAGKDAELELKLQEQKKAFDELDLFKTFQAKANALPLASVYNEPEIKAAISDNIWKEMQKEAHYKMVNDEIGVFQLDMHDKEIYGEGNKKETFQNKLESKFSKYLKKSDPVGESKKRALEPKNDLTPQEQSHIAYNKAMKERYANSERS